MKANLPTHAQAQVQALALAVLTVTWGCGREDLQLLAVTPDNTDAQTLTEDAEIIIQPGDAELQPQARTNGFSFNLAGTEFFCPNEFAFNSSTKLCESATEAIGPFTETMRINCEKWGGGSACQNTTWSLSFARKLRGTGPCMNGATPLTSGLCVEGENAFGPFTPQQVEKCQTWGGGSTCETMRWNRKFAEATLPAPGPTPAPIPVPTPPSQSRRLEGLKVALDTGHGMFKSSSSSGFDPGAINPFHRDVIEYDINRNVGFIVRDLLQAEGAKVYVFTYPRGSSLLTLAQKGYRSTGHDLFISIHHNSSASHTAQGSEVFVHKTYSSSDRSFAAAIQRRFVQRVWGNNSIYNRGVKSASLGVLGGVPSNVDAAVLVEAYFLDTSAITLQKSTQLTPLAAQAIAEGVGEFWLSR